MTLQNRFLDTASRFPDKVAVIQGARRVTYGELLGQATGLASRLVLLGVSPGDRVLILLENSPEYMSAFFAILSAGAIAVPLGDLTGRRGLRGIADDCRPKAVFARSRNLDAVRDSLPVSFPTEMLLALDDAPPELTGDRFPVQPGEPSDPALILYTSGTTGKPKGVLLTHRNLCSNADSIIRSLRLNEHDRAMTVLPFHYSYGNSLMTTHVTVGGSLVLENSFLFPNRVLERMVEEEVTGFSGVPSTFALLLSRSTLRSFEFPHLRYVTQAGGALPPAHAEELGRIFAGKEFFIMYGQTEATARLTCLDPADRPGRPGSVGREIPGVSISLYTDGREVTEPWDSGEVVVRGENVMAGYWEDPEGTGRVLRPEGLYTGDHGCRDEDGFLYIVGRGSDFIKSGGHRIGAREIEEVLHEIPAVAEAAVIGVKDDVLGEALKAFLVLREGASTDRMEVLAYCRANLPPHKIPRDLEFLDALPRTESGKIRKAALAEGGSIPPGGTRGGEG